MVNNSSTSSSSTAPSTHQQQQQQRQTHDNQCSCTCTMKQTKKDQSSRRGRSGKNHEASATSRHSPPSQPRKQFSDEQQLLQQINQERNKQQQLPQQQNIIEGKNLNSKLAKQKTSHDNIFLDSDDSDEYRNLKPTTSFVQNFDDNESKQSEINNKNKNNNNNNNIDEDKQNAVDLDWDSLVHDDKLEEKYTGQMSTVD
ncbi:hypothetical protein HELRODRAFT_169366 [Helobdella robusta]|uniref:Uncharacterized protein n=1 Tax=Helobdella robusta TaxID=6412 RepID=T1F1U8_HELRO|nr:hypothetical protein HELRODRAFT_169366 [Helobdella robusta]ESO08507.1 hypothetical protein HELRODRAFT_169366 [Helobdella robusta]